MANNAASFTVGGNDEHGVNPPTPGKRTPVMPYVNRSIYENEFNRAAKQRFLEACLRIGFNVYDVKPEYNDISITERVRRINAQNLTRLVTYGYNAYGSGSVFTNATGFVVAYASRNPYPESSRAYCEDIASALENIGLRLNSLQDLDIGVLGSVNCVSALVEPGFMTDFTEATLMLDPDFVTAVAEATARATCVNLDVPYIERGNLSAYPVLREGDRGNKVRLLQYLLNSAGYDAAPDGIFGAQTANALRAFQTANALAADGVAGGGTYSRLLLTEGLTPVSAGATGNTVRYLQQKLLAKLYPVDVDGVYGDGTREAVRQFQIERGLPPTGNVNAATAAAVSETGNPRPRLY